MTDETILDMMKVMADHNLIRETDYIHACIKVEYKKLRKSGISGKLARETLAEKHFTTEKNIQAILYGNKGKDGNVRD